jgi:hypothetical protein
VTSTRSYGFGAAWPGSLSATRLDAGHAVVVVQTADDAMAERMGKVMAERGGRFVNRYTRWAAVSVVP